jgi:5-methylcytosine-specific restriction endonuclease McrA
MVGSDYRRLVAACAHDKPAFPTTGRLRRACFECVPKVSKGPRKPKNDPRDKTPKPCAQCGALFVRCAGAKFCGDACRLADQAARRGAARKASFVSETRRCRFCAAEFVTRSGLERRRVFCSGACRVKDTHRRLSTGNTHIRRAKRYGSEWEYVDKWAVFARDRWRCQICGTSTPRRLSGTKDPRAPELDHIVPLSKGGAHVESNVQCTCHACNAAKKARPMGQMRIALAA